MVLGEVPLRDSDKEESDRNDDDNKLEPLFDPFDVMVLLLSTEFVFGIIDGVDGGAILLKRAIPREIAEDWDS